MVVTNSPSAAISSAKLSIVQKWRRFWTELTVEPLVFCYVIPVIVTALTNQNMYLEKACRVNMNYSSALCDELMLRNTTGIEEEDQQTEAVVTAIRKWTLPLNSWLQGSLILFWGAWSDRSGRRKPCIIIPLSAQLIVTLVHLTTSSIFERTPLEVPAYTVAIVDGVSGGASVLLVGIYSYISDVTSGDQMLYRIGLINSSLQLGNILGTVASGHLVRHLGYLAVYSMCTAMLVFSLVYAIAFIKESPLAAAGADALPTDNQTSFSQRSVLAQFFDYHHVTNTFQVIFRDGPARRRLRIILLIVVWIVVTGPSQGESEVWYFFTRVQFSWTEVELSYFSTYNLVTTFVGITIIIELLSNRLKIADALIAMFGTLSKMGANTVYSLSFASWMLFVGAAIEMFSTGTGIAVRSIASKVVLADEVGKLNALLGLVESFEPTVYAPLYLAVWEATRDHLTVTFLLMSIALVSPALVIFWWMHRINKALDATDAEQAGEKTTQPADSTELAQPSTIVAEKTLVDSENTYL